MSDFFLNSVVNALWILALLGGILAVVLVVAAKYLHVEEDKRIEEVTKLLPGYNCGACGFPGCGGFASAIVEGKVQKLSLCKPGKPEKNFEPIIEFLTKDSPDDKVAVKLKI